MKISLFMHHLLSLFNLFWTKARDPYNCEKMASADVRKIISSPSSELKQAFRTSIFMSKFNKKWDENKIKITKFEHINNQGNTPGELKKHN